MFHTLRAARCPPTPPGDPARSLQARAVPGRRARALKILAADPVDPLYAQVFADNGHKLVEKKMNREQLLEAIPAYDGLVVRSGVKVTDDIIAAGTRLKVIGRAGAGVDNIDCVAATKRGVVVMNTPGGNTAAAAELTLTLLMSLARQIPQACAALKVRAPVVAAVVVVCGGRLPRGVCAPVRALSQPPPPVRQSLRLPSTTSRHPTAACRVARGTARSTATASSWRARRSASWGWA